jgi:tRNA modification GTPase
MAGWRMRAATENMFDDTIAAIATPLGEGGLAVIRLSGPDATRVADRCFFPAKPGGLPPSACPTHTLHYGFIKRQGQRIDEVMLALMRAPRTFTREDVVEISCHGGLLCAKTVLDTLLEAGARLALPGEFTKRAFLNGRIDLAQAEAVADLIGSRTELALAAANEQLAGKLSRRIEALRGDLMGVLAHLEAHIDFPDEDIAPDTRAKLIERCERASQFIVELLRTANEGQILRRGVRAAIIGRPNTGKSSLLNQLLGHERAIVSPIAGTTRDTIEETANVRGIPIVFIDTAGLREAADPIEKEGIRRSKTALDQAELILQVVDLSIPWDAAADHDWTDHDGKKRILVRNKSDLPRQWTPPPGLEAPAVDVCCLTGAGIETLKDAIIQRVWNGDLRPDAMPVMINSRHQDALRRAQVSLGETLISLRLDKSLELVAMDLRAAVNAIGEIVGKTTTEDLLDTIFSQFCLGK